MSRKALALMAVGTLTLLLGASARTGLLNHTTVSDVNAVLRARAPVGSSAQRVVAVLDSLKVEHGEFDSNKQVIYAVWRRTKVSLFSHSDIAARFFFDEEKRLTRYELEEVITAM